MKTKKSLSTENSCVEKEKVNKVKEMMKSENFFHYLAETFKAMSDPTRTKIIYALCQENELCVRDIASIIGTTTSAVSHQLRTLRNMKLVKYNRVGKITYYSLDDIHINNLFAEGLRHVEEK
ncbi:MAG TPA: metalloregulator ArsR/SmtB family transcription factor [Bacteroidales bacterium]|nr:helix-turn-helix transcriptional regulator [Bacteroidales bacterium]HCI56108.1 transcriptional regulator [Bacteroidales bacterium]HOU96685.1 metalloregulator ArsR/SmtB family transcription factor [Bacteroidales bacterium]HQG37092.1 metalloregulator ArsR/SmtB family transcription factor [Bacteroidales bacterium]HQG52437.1 metalloregulator ArsR/SmtB family transcription factor [Bacteroidales bacterium]